MSKLTGTVKWFSNQKGFGFITVDPKEGEEKGEDIFVHQTSIVAPEGRYRTVVSSLQFYFTLGCAAGRYPSGVGAWAVNEHL
jgi:hypothetical protein